jgi:hypothetical protein
MGWEKDLPPGEQLVRCFRPFLEYLAASDLAPKTIQKHVDNLWVLGGEIIRDLNETPSLRKASVHWLLSEAVSEDGGPLIHHGDSEEQQRSFDATCRKLHRFLAQPGH